MSVGKVDSGAGDWMSVPLTTVRPANKSAAQIAIEEATETIAATKAEAAKGDQQAIRKLARVEAAKNSQSPNQSAETSIVSGRSLNVTA